MIPAVSIRVVVEFCSVRICVLARLDLIFEEIWNVAQKAEQKRANNLCVPHPFLESNNLHLLNLLKHFSHSVHQGLL